MWTVAHGPFYSHSKRTKHTYLGSCDTVVARHLLRQFFRRERWLMCNDPWQGRSGSGLRDTVEKPSGHGWSSCSPRGDGGAGVWTIRLVESEVTILIYIYIILRTLNL
ncbi:hypothetical protein BJV77DRAFT_1044128 [Russula vinacea]|nr:hypothetical protein BJV77DRAFT_1044128 [Russula vinacea]